MIQNLTCAEPNYTELSARNRRVNKFYFNLERLGRCFSLTRPSIETWNGFDSDVNIFMCRT